MQHLTASSQITNSDLIIVKALKTMLAIANIPHNILSNDSVTQSNMNIEKYANMKQLYNPIRTNYFPYALKGADLTCRH